MSIPLYSDRIFNNRISKINIELKDIIYCYKYKFSSFLDKGTHKILSKCFSSFDLYQFHENIPYIFCTSEYVNNT